MIASDGLHQNISDYNQFLFIKDLKLLKKHIFSSEYVFIYRNNVIIIITDKKTPIYVKNVNITFYHKKSTSHIKNVLT